MDGKDSVWICLSDLLAGLMAFFVFVTAGVYADYLGMDGLAYGDLSPAVSGKKAEGGNQADPKATLYLKAHRFPHSTFERGGYELADSQVDTVNATAMDIGNYISSNGNGWKVLIVGHASCSSDLTDENMADRVPGWAKLPKPEREKTLHVEANLINTRYSLNRAYEVFKILWSNDTIKNNGKDNIRLIGMSERRAAERQSDIMCRDRGSSDEESRIVEVFVLKQWPTHTQLDTMSADSTVTSEPASPVAPPPTAYPRL